MGKIDVARVVFSSAFLSNMGRNCADVRAPVGTSAIGEVRAENGVVCGADIRFERDKREHTLFLQYKYITL